jgi:hypothetical protein
LQVFDFIKADFAILMVFEFFLMTGVSVVNIPSQETRKNLIIESSFAVVTFPFTPSAPAAMRGSMCDCGACGNGNVLS